jgi:alpha/beta superfamily hydrolase
VKVAFFGPSQTPLMGAFHSGEESSTSPALLLCPSIGHENGRAHRALRIAAERWKGPAFRFDWRGCGDSWGEAPASLHQLSEDLLIALNEVRALAPNHKLVVVGLRLGALIAAHTLRSRENAPPVVGWHAPSSGAQWMKEIDQLDHNARNLSLVARNLHVEDERIGYLYPEQLLKDIPELCIVPERNVTHPVSEDWTIALRREVPWMPGPSLELLMRSLTL